MSHVSLTERASLHPARAQISPAEFAACMNKRPTVELTDLLVLETYRERATIPGTDVRANTVAITVRFKAKRGTLTQTATDTAHQIYDKGRWRFVRPTRTSSTSASRRARTPEARCVSPEASTPAPTHSSAAFLATARRRKSVSRSSLHRLGALTPLASVEQGIMQTAGTFSCASAAPRRPGTRGQSP